MYAIRSYYGLNSLPATVDTILLAGAEAHICIFQTAMGAMKAGYHPWIAADAVSSREKRNAESYNFV